MFELLYGLVNLMFLLIIYFYLYNLKYKIDAKRVDKINDKIFSDIALKVGIDRDSLSNSENIQETKKVMYELYSDEKIVNRIANLFSIPYRIIVEGSFLIEAAIFIWACWQVFLEPRNGHYFWLVLFAFFFFWLLSFTFWKLCFLLTGRYPGHPKNAIEGLKTL